MFANRTEAGKKLAEALSKYKGKSALVLALPRGGVPIGYEVSKALAASLDTRVARKVGMPGNPEYAIGAIAPGLPWPGRPGQGGVFVSDIPLQDVESAVESETREMERRMQRYRSGSYTRGVKPEVVIVVDDGVATGKTAIAALRSVRKSHPEAKLVFAAPVGAPDSLASLIGEADEVVFLMAPPEFMAVGEWYASFPQLSDDEVISLLERARQFDKRA